MAENFFSPILSRSLLPNATDGLQTIKLHRRLIQDKKLMRGYYVEYLVEYLMSNINLFDNKFQ